MIFSSWFFLSSQHKYNTWFWSFTLFFIQEAGPCHAAEIREEDSCESSLIGRTPSHGISMAASAQHRRRDRATNGAGLWNACRGLWTDQTTSSCMFLWSEPSLRVRPYLFVCVLQETEGYSGSDIRLVCKEAAMKPVRKLIHALESHQHGKTH